MHRILKKGGLAVLIVLIYFFGIRELRQEVHDLYMGTVLPDEYGQINDDYSFYSQSSVSFTIIPNSTSSQISWQFRIPFDSYWLFGTFVLILIGASKKEYIVLSTIHLVSGISNTILVAIGIFGYDIFLILTDFNCRYLIPLASLGYVAVIVGTKKSKSSSHVHTS